jgi:signal recognition particle subunit SRP19
MGSLKVIYPIYFERSVSRKKGRRATKDRSFDNVKLDDLIKAVRKMGLKYTEEKKKHHSARWWLKEGRLLVNADMGKEELIRKIAGALKEDFANRTTEGPSH